MPSWYNPSWTYALPVTVTNGSTSSALAYAQAGFTLTGAAYTSLTTHGQAGLIDIVVTDSDGVTTLPFALEGIDSINSVVYLLVKVSLPANTSKTIYVYYGNPAASSTSSYPGTITPQAALSGPTDLVTQSPATGYHSNPKLIRLQHQTGASASRNGDLLGFFLYKGSANGGADCHIGMLRCPNGSDPAVVGNWTVTDLLSPVSGNGVPVEVAGEMANGTIFIIYQNATNAVINTATGTFYCGKSTDGGQTWSNVSTSATNPMPVVTGATLGTDSQMWWGQQWIDSTNNTYMSMYSRVGGGTIYGSYLFKLSAGADPSVGSNWSQFATIAKDAGNQINYNEPNILETSPGSGNLICLMRNDGSSPNTGDLYVARSTNGGVSWSASAALGLPGAGTSAGSSNAPSPWLLRLASGNLLLHFGNRSANSLDPAVGSHQIYGDMAVLSTDGGASFFDRYFAAPAQFDNGGLGTSRVDYGVGSSVQLPDGRIVMLSMRSVSATFTANIILMVFTEDWLANSVNVYDGCESLGTQWTHGATATISTTHVHSGTNAIKMDNSAGVGSYAYLTPWVNPIRNPGKQAVSAWTYATQIATAGCSLSLIDFASSATKANVNVFNTPYHAKWYNGTAYQDTTVVAGINAWYKLTENFSAPGNLGIILVNDAVAATNQTQWSTSTVLPKNAMLVAYSSTAGGQADTWWVDDVQVHQYLPAMPTFSVGAEIPLNASASGSITLAGATVAASVTDAASGAVISASITLAGATATGSVTAAAAPASQLTAALPLAGATVTATMTAAPSPSAITAGIVLAGASAQSLVSTGSGGVTLPSSTLSATLSLAGASVFAVVSAPGAGAPIFVDPDLGSLILP